MNASSFSDEQEDASSRSRWVIEVQVQESSYEHAPIENGDTASNYDQKIAQILFYQVLTGRNMFQNYFIPIEKSRRGKKLDWKVLWSKEKSGRRTAASGSTNEKNNNKQKTQKNLRMGR